MRHGLIWAVFDVAATCVAPQSLQGLRDPPGGEGGERCSLLPVPLARTRWSCVPHMAALLLPATSVLVKVMSDSN